jgi:ATP-dependent Lon protease
VLGILYEETEFRNFCLEPALEKRGIIRKQLNMIDNEFKEDLLEIKIKK